MEKVILKLQEHFLCIREDGSGHIIDGQMIFHHSPSGTFSTLRVNDAVIQKFLAENSVVILEHEGNQKNSACPTSSASGSDLTPEASASPTGSSSVAVVTGRADVGPRDESREEIWVKNTKPTPTDIAATADLIKIIGREEIQKLLDDKKTVKKKIWENIGSEMKLKYNLGNRDEGSVCSQKWRNLVSAVLNFLQNAGGGSTGSGKMKQPAFYDEVFDVIKGKHKTTPARLLDSLPGSSTSAAHTPSNSSASKTPDNTKPSTSSIASLKRNTSDMFSIQSDSASSEAEGDPVSPFSTVKCTSKPKRAKVDSGSILSFLKMEADERKKQNHAMMKLVEDSNNTKKSFLEVFTKLLSSNGKSD